MPFRKFVAKCVDLWNRASSADEEAGRPYGPAGVGDNLISWIVTRIEAANHIQVAEEILGLDECSD
ncbi:MAG: hypothetical protein ABIQ47_10695 [Tepidiformaceae bacterium]